MTAVRYAPEVFSRPRIADAKAIILTPEQGKTTTERWEEETAWLMPHLSFPPGALVIDYGCGIGRVAKRLTDNPVLGVDISSTMRANAESYVARKEFSVAGPAGLRIQRNAGLRAHGALAIWVLQHCERPEEDIDLLASCLFPGSPLYVVNRNERCVPSMTADGKFGWADDGVDVYRLLAKCFDGIERIPLPETLCAPGAELTTWVRKNHGIDISIVEDGVTVIKAKP